MKRTLCSIAAILFTVLVYAQNDEPARWSPEFSAKAFVSVYHGAYEFTAGARVNDNVFGLGSGYAREFWDAYPASVKKIPVYGFYRRYIPMGKKRRLLFVGEATLGGECVYKITGDHLNGEEFPSTPYWNWRASLTPSIALRLFGNTSIFLGPTLEIMHSLDFMPGLTAGINIGF